jgi:hypothetical protein
MASSIEDNVAALKIEYPGPLKINDRDMTDEEYEAKILEWATNKNTLDLDEEANGWLYNRQAEYPSLQDCIHALLDGGDTLTDLQAARQAVKDKYPKG